MSDPNPDDSAEVALTGQNAVETREKAVAARADLARGRADLERKEAEARAELDRQKRELEEAFAAKRAELEAQMGPVKEQLAQMAEVLFAVDLYLGRDETLRLLRDGTPAPANIPITLRQRVLVMAEESLVLMGRKTTGMDANDVPEFVNWLLEDDSHLNRVLPEPKGAVVLIPTKVQSTSGNIFEDEARNEANQQAYWLVRNGQKLYLLKTDPELRIHDRVLPKRAEFTEVFERRLFGYSGQKLGDPVEPGSKEWMAMEKRASALQRHYMRVLLVLQGLIDRTPAWHPLPEGGASFLRLADQDEGRIRLIQDGDDSLQLDDGRETFTEWQRRLNKQLRPGMRIVGNFHSQGWRNEGEPGPDGRTSLYGRHTRVHPDNASHPPTGEPLLLEGRRDGGFVARYERTDEVWKEVEEPVPDKPGYVYVYEKPVAPERRASCVVKTSDDWVIAYDLASINDLEYYLNSRENRSSHFLSMVPVIQAALDAKKAEADQEAPFRGLLTSHLIKLGADSDEAPALVENLVHWWKIANTWARPLNGAPDYEAKAHREIGEEFTHRRGHETDPFRDTAIRVGKAVSGALSVTRNRQGQWHVYSASAPAHEPGVFVDITPIRKDGTLGTPKREQTPTQRGISALHVAWAAEEWETWAFGAHRHHYLTSAEREQAVDQMRQLATGAALCVTEVHDPVQNPGERTMAVYWWAATQPPEKLSARAVSDPYSGHYSRGNEALIVSAVRRVTKDSDGVHLTETRHHGHARAFGKYSMMAGTRWIEVPWDTRSRPFDVRPSLLWGNEDALDRVQDYRERCQTALRAERDEKTRHEAEVYRYSRPIERAILARQIADARARFNEDYGRESDDLWPAHLESLGLRVPIHPRELWGLVATALDHGHPVIGQTLGQLADFAEEQKNRAPGEWHPGRGRVDVKEYGDLVVPEPEEERIS